MTTLKNLSLLLARVLIGVILVAHGWQKFFEWGLSGTAESFATIGVPAPALAGTVAAVIELAGGILLIVGVATTWVALIVALEMFGAFFFGHLGHGIFISNGGFELTWAIAAACLALVGAGAGRFSVDSLLTRSPQR